MPKFDHGKMGHNFIKNINIILNITNSNWINKFQILKLKT